MTHDGKLTVTVRNTRGKGAARSMRREGLIPAVVYGGRNENVAISIDPAEFRKATSLDLQWNTYFQLVIQEDGKAEFVEPCLLADVQRDPVRRDIVHLDFMRVDPEREVTRKVPVVYTGRSIGVSKGGKLKTFRRLTTVAARPAFIPKEVNVDITNVDEGQSLRVEDIVLENARIVENPKVQLCHVEMPKAKKEEPEDDKKKAAAKKK